MKKNKKLLLGASTPKDDSRYVGANLAPNTYNHITLYSLAHGIPKSRIFKNMIEEWIENNILIQSPSEEPLIELIVERVKEQWDKYKSEHPRASFINFKGMIKTELINKKLKSSQIKKILNKIEE